MTLHCETINPLESSRWDDLVANRPGSSVFHTSDWMRMLHETYGYDSRAFIFSENDQLVALVPIMQVSSLFSRKRGVSLPFSDYCDPLILQPEWAGIMMGRLVSLSRSAGWQTLELRGGNLGFAGIPRSSFWYRHTLDLSVGEKALMASFRESTIRNIRKAEKEGVETDISTSWQSVETFYRLNCLTRQRHGLPPQPLTFFRQLHHHLIGKNKGIVILAYQDRQPIAGAVFLHHAHQAHYKYGASNPKYQHLRANNLVMWEGIRWHLEQGYQNFCFGRTEPDNKGLRQFKAGWGAVEQTINYIKYDLRRDSFVQENPMPKEWQTNIGRMLPLPVLRAVGTVLYRSMG